MKRSVVGTSRLFLATLIILGLFIALESAAQMRGRGQGRMGGPFYNTGTELTITGTVEEVQQVTGQMGTGQGWTCPRGWSGTHLMLKTDAGTMLVHVGPSAYLASKNFSIAKGDQLTILGSKVQYQASDFLIAKEITKGDQVLTLRNSAGFPLWSGFRMGSTPLPGAPVGK
ncbi:MAG TPA: hypothetical protein VF133_11025 [Terriglobales bacterium]